MSFDPKTPYNSLPPLPPQQEVETTAVLRKAISAGRVLAELKGLGETIPNQGILINTLILQEAKASSEIENIITTNDALFRASSSDSMESDPATKEVIRYRQALWEEYQSLRDRPILGTNLFIKLVQTIKENQAGIRNAPGTKVMNANTGEVIFTPPEGETILREKLHQLETFIHEESPMDPLIKMALIHYQFETIHPFFDGNGRTGRIINILYLVLTGLLDLPVLYLSKHIIETKGQYYSHLREVTTNQAWEPWILYMLEAIEQTAAFTRQRILAIRNLLEETLAGTKETLPGRIYSKELIELIFHHPYTKAQFLVERGIAKRQTAAQYLKALEGIGLLTCHKVGRENLYLNQRLFDLLST